MSFGVLAIEKALEKITQDKNKYVQTATIFERILKDSSTTSEEKAQKIAELIEKGNKAKV